MPDLLFGYLVRDATSDPYGERFYADGKVESYRVSKLVEAASGEYRDQPVIPGWYPTTTLSEELLAKARAAIDTSGVRELPETITGAHSTSDPASGELELMAGDGIRKITVTPWFPGGDVGQRLFNLITQLNNLITQALA
ncbi:MAG: hypothetical protein UZ15_CFX003002448 [Chloroflexi bacterium OLB15]|nr:MAG: hypothetical protein UZ15_CFX003002448 [Chloroflexi bacterium OLB15]